MEKCQKIVCLKYKHLWDDIGTWSAVANYNDNNFEKNNVFIYNKIQEEKTIILILKIRISKIYILIEQH